MRKIITLVLAATISIPAVAKYQDGTGPSFAYDQFRYEILDPTEKTVAFIGFNSENPTVPADFTIPSSVSVTFPSDFGDEYSGTYRVTQINTFSIGDIPVKNLTIPGSVKVVGPRAFYHLNELETITFEKSETPIEYYPAFLPEGNTSVKIINVNRSIITEKDNENFGAFFIWGENASLSEVNIGSDVQKIGAGLFKDTPVDKVNIADWNKWLNDVELEDVTANPYYMGESEVYGNNIHITTVELREGMESIQDYVLAGLPYQGELTLPSSIKHIGAYSFYNCNELYWVDFPEGLESIGDHAFDGCEILEFASFPQSLRSIGEYAFKDCQTLSSITLPEEMTSMGRGAFANNIRLEKAILFSNLEELPAEAFSKCTNLSQIYLPKKLKSIGDFCFYLTPQLENISFPETLERIGDCAFFALHTYDSNTLRDIDLNTVAIIWSITNSYNWLYFGDTGLTEITLPASLKSVGKLAFAGCRFIVADLGAGLETIDDYAFYDCDRLKDIRFSDNLISIGAGAFETNQHFYSGVIGYGLNTINLPPSVTTIGKNAFMNRIGELTIPDGVTTLESGSCGYASILNIGSGVKNIADGAIYLPNENVGLNLRLIRIKAQTPPSVAAAFPFSETDYDKITLVVNNGCKDAYSRNPRWRNFTIVEESESDKTIHVTGETPITEEIRLQSGIMPSRLSKMTVTGTLAPSDFRLIRENMLSLYSLDLSAISNTEIPAEAFKGMTLLTEIILPSGTTSIGDEAFYGCSLMNTPSLPESLQTIGRDAFNGCGMLSITEIPANVTEIGESAFNKCSALRELNVYGQLQSIGNFTFEDASLLETVDLSGTAVRTIGYGAFSNCRNLAFVDLPESLETIGSGAFSNSGLAAVELGKKVNNIGDRAFEGTRLRTVTIPEAVTEIADYSFADCKKLVAANLPQQLTAIGTEVFSNSLKLSAISCRAIDAPEAKTGAFNGVRAAHCSLTVPSQSFRSYLNAAQWGMFAELINRLTVEIPEGIEVSAIDEEDYQEIMEEETLEEESKTPEEQESPKAARRRALATGLANGSTYAALFNGATLGSAGGKGTRIFIHVKEGDEITSVSYNGKDITSELIDGSVLIPGNANGSLKIGGKSSVEEINVNPDNDADCIIYDLAGCPVFSGRCADADLPAGIYLIRQGSQTFKKVIR